MIRTYELKTEMNKSKKEKVLSVMEEYRHTASLIAKKRRMKIKFSEES
ncbi:MAG: hypothetical protein ABRQ38_28635 [Candidatus Eremiobacterota bacterium]